MPEYPRDFSRPDHWAHLADDRVQSLIDELISEGYPKIEAGDVVVERKTDVIVVWRMEGVATAPED